jgi:hypothetical protein
MTDGTAARAGGKADCATGRPGRMSKRLLAERVRPGISTPLACAVEAAASRFGRRSRTEPRAAGLTILAADHPEAAAGDRREASAQQGASSISGASSGKRSCWSVCCAEAGKDREGQRCDGT